MERRKIIENQWVTFLEDKFQLPNGADCTYYHAQKADAVMTIAIDTVAAEHYTYIVNQHRHPIGHTIWQFPMGGFDSQTEDPIEASRKELQEETGLLAGDIQYLGSFYADPGFTNQKVHVCGTKDIQQRGEQKLEASEHGLVCKRIPVTTVASLISSGDMGDAWGLAGQFYLHALLGENQKISTTQ